MAFELPQLPYAMDALAPYMSAETLEYHHGKHHNAYVTNGNNLLKGSGLESKPIEEVIRATYGEASKTGLFNNAAQVWNHTFFWNSMKPGNGGIPSELERRLAADFGGFDAFKEKFVEAAVGQFGSGWAWLVLDKGKLAVTKTPNAENPLCHGQVPLLTCDVWEHAYYIDYRNRRPDFAKAWVDHLANWEFAAANLEAAMAGAG